MGSIGRKMARNQKKNAKKKMKEEMALFDKLGDECLVCQKPYDKTNKEHVTNWFVTVRKQEGVVNLYCPDCWENANKIIEDFMEREAEKNDNP
jgi:hypothetical protein